MGLGIDIRHRIAKRAAAEIKNGMIVNLGIGIPSLIPNYVPSAVHVMFHAENGILGLGSSPPLGEEDENVAMQQAIQQLPFKGLHTVTVLQPSR